METDPSIVDKIDALLPQTQCRKCAYPGCRPYAEAIAAGRAEINQCPPGGDAGVRALADLLGRDPKPLNPDHGQPTPGGVAVIDEQTCIGCTLCIQACPVDAILGAAKFMHTVIEQECTGCELCIAPCPVECIVLKPFDPALSDWKQPFTGFGRERAERARRRHQIHLARTERDKQERAAKLRDKAHPADSADLKRALIKAAVARVKAKRALAGRWP